MRLFISFTFLIRIISAAEIDMFEVNNDETGISSFDSWVLDSAEEESFENVDLSMDSLAPQDQVDFVDLDMHDNMLTSTDGNPSSLFASVGGDCAVDTQVLGRLRTRRQTCPAEDSIAPSNLVPFVPIEVQPFINFATKQLKPVCTKGNPNGLGINLICSSGDPNDIEAVWNYPFHFHLSRCTLSKFMIFSNFFFFEKCRY
jgi:hypothetical protein